MTAVLRLVEEPPARPTNAEALEDLLADDDRLWETFEGACWAGLVELRDIVLGVRAALLERGHAFDTHDEQFGETFVALLAVAEDLLPGSPGAARGRLRERVQDDVRPRPGGGVRIEGDVSVRRAAGVVLAFEDKLFDEVVLAAGSGHKRLHAAAQRIRKGLASIGREYPVEEVEDELWMVVREFFPDAPAAAPDTERLEDLWRRAQAYVDEHDPDGVLGEEERGGHEIPALAATKRHDLPGLRVALREMCRSARYAARKESGDGGVGNEE